MWEAGTGQDELTPIQVVGIGLDGVTGLAERVRSLLSRATVLVGSERHLSYFAHHPAEQWLLNSIPHTLERIRHTLESSLGPNAQCPPPLIIILTSGDPLFFGLGRLLLAELPPNWMTFHPHLSAVQLAFSRIKVPWQDARCISAHGRSLEEVTHALQQGAEKIAVFTDAVHSPAAIARLVVSLTLPYRYGCWVCENLGSDTERISCQPPEALVCETFDPLNVVILLRQASDITLDLKSLPIMGIEDTAFLSFSDRPGLMTKREVRLLVLGELALQAHQVVWDIGAGTGSVAIELARLVPTAQVYALEKTAAGFSLIQQNCRRFQVENVHPRHATAPDGLAELPRPHRVFIGGSGGHLSPILSAGGEALLPGGLMVLALATLEHQSEVLQWVQHQNQAGSEWHYRLLQVQLARSVAIASLTRFSPLNPVTVVVLTKNGAGSLAG